MKKILVTGGESRFAKTLKKTKTQHKLIFKNKKDLNILEINSINKNIQKFKPNYILHLAGLSRPMKMHDENISKSIDLNIIGTCNLVKACAQFKIKLIYFSTSYVYQGIKGNYKETDPVLPWNNYAWSKLGGEAAVQMYKNSLILRVSMTEKPFVHNEAYANVKSNFMFHEEASKMLIKMVHKKGIYNFGGKSQTVYNFIKIEKKDVKKKYSKGEFPKKQDMNLAKITKII